MYFSEYEGCLSVPNIRGKVERYYDITVTYYTETGKKVVKEVSGFTARDIQHECDHLDGIVFLNRVTEKGYAIFGIGLDLLPREPLKSCSYFFSP